MSKKDKMYVLYRLTILGVLSYLFLLVVYSFIVYSPFTNVETRIVNVTDVWYMNSGIMVQSQDAVVRIFSPYKEE